MVSSGIALLVWCFRISLLRVETLSTKCIKRTGDNGPCWTPTAGNANHAPATTHALVAPHLGYHEKSDCLFQINQTHFDWLGKLPWTIKYPVEGIELVQCSTTRTKAPFPCLWLWRLSVIQVVVNLVVEASSVLSQNSQTDQLLRFNYQNFLCRRVSAASSATSACYAKLVSSTTASWGHSWCQNSPIYHPVNIHIQECLLPIITENKKCYSVLLATSSYLYPVNIMGFCISLTQNESYPRPYSEQQHSTPLICNKHPKSSVQRIFLGHFRGQLRKHHSVPRGNQRKQLPI